MGRQARVSEVVTAGEPSPPAKNLRFGHAILISNGRCARACATSYRRGRERESTIVANQLNQIGVKALFEWLISSHTVNCRPPRQLHRLIQVAKRLKKLKGLTPYE